MINQEDYGNFLRNVVLGADIETSALANGISLQELYHLMERGMHEDRRISGTNKKPFKKEEDALRIWRGVTKAQAEAKMRIQTSLFREVQEDWRGALGWLERRDFNNFGKVEDRIKASEIENKIKEIEG